MRALTVSASEEMPKVIPMKIPAAAQAVFNASCPLHLQAIASTLCKAGFDKGQKRSVPFEATIH